MGSFILASVSMDDLPPPPPMGQYRPGRDWTESVSMDDVPAPPPMGKLRRNWGNYIKGCDAAILDKSTRMEELEIAIMQDDRDEIQELEQYLREIDQFMEDN